VLDLVQVSFRVGRTARRGPKPAGSNGYPTAITTAYNAGSVAWSHRYSGHGGKERANLVTTL